MKGRLPQTAPWVRREDYDAFKRLIPNDPYLPDTFDEWLQVASQQIAKAEALGIPVEKVILDPYKFAAYCNACGQRPNSVMLMGFTVAEAQTRKL